jgi:O-antigen biosynthesis protein
MPYYSFIMTCNNQWRFTEQAISTFVESISPLHKNKGIELIVINSGSTDGTGAGIEKLKVQFGKEIEIIPVNFEKNIGYLIGTNIGFSMCRGEIITLLNNDLIFPERWFDGIARTLESDSSIGAAAPFLSYASGSAGVGVTLNSLQEIKDFSAKFMENNKIKVLFTNRIIGACISIKRALLSAIGGNDYWFGLGWFEDADWSLRACMAGYKIAIVGASFVYHIGNATIGQHSGLVTAALKSNGDKFSRKWNVVSGFNEKELVDRTVFSKEKHYFPCRIDDFNPISSLRKHDNAENEKMLFLADWTNECSGWKNKLSEIKSIMKENQHLTLWAPKSYYSEEIIKKETNTVIGGNQTGMAFDFNDVFPINLLNYLNNYDSFITVENDFVNLYFKYLIEQAMKISIFDSSRRFCL